MSFSCGVKEWRLIQLVLLSRIGSQLDEFPQKLASAFPRGVENRGLAEVVHDVEVCLQRVEVVKQLNASLFRDIEERSLVVFVCLLEVGPVSNQE